MTKLKHILTLIFVSIALFILWPLSKVEDLYIKLKRSLILNDSEK